MSMHKGKHQGGPNQGFTRYPQNAYSQRQQTPQRTDVYHVAPGYAPQSGGGPNHGPSGGPQMRSMGISQMPQPTQQGPGGPAPTSTPPADMNKAIHMQGQNQLPQGAQMQMPFSVANAPRQSAPTAFYQPRAATTRMPSRNPAIFGVGNGQQIVPSQLQTMSMYPMPYMGGSQLPTMYQHQGMNTSGRQFYTNQQQQAVLIASAPYNANNLQMYYSMPFRSGAPGVNMAGAAPQGQQGVQPGPSQGQAPVIAMNPIMSGVSTPSQSTGTSSASMPSQSKPRRHALQILDPVSGRNVLDDMEKEKSASGSSSNRETPQPESVPNHDVAAEFAERVTKAATEDSTPSAPTRPPDPSSAPPSQNKLPLAHPDSTGETADPSFSQSVEDASNLGNIWSKGGHKPSGEMGERPPENVFYYPSVIHPNVSAKPMDLNPEMYANMAPQLNMPGVTTIMHGPMVGPGPGRPGQGLPTSLAISEQTPVVSANTNSQSVSIEVLREPYPASRPQQAGGVGGAHQGSHPSPQRRKRDNNNTVSTTASTMVPSMATSDTTSQLPDTKPSKKGSPTPLQSVAPSSQQGQGKVAPLKDNKRDKGRERASTPKDASGKDAVVTADNKPAAINEKTAAAAAVVSAAPAPVPIPAVTPSAAAVPATKGKTTAPVVAVTVATDKPLAHAPVVTTGAGGVGAQAAAAPPAPVESKQEKNATAGGRPRPSANEPVAENDGKGSGRGKGKKMRDSSAKGAERDGSDVDTLTEPVAETSEECATPPHPASAPTPAVSQASAPAAPEATPSPVAAATPTAPAAAPAPVVVADPALPSTETAAVAAAPSAAPASNSSVPQPAVPATAPKTEPVPAPVPAPVVRTIPPNPVLGGPINLFAPPFATPQMPIATKALIPSNKDEEKGGEEKERSIVVAKNEENAKVSAAMKDEAPAAEKRRIYAADQWSPSNPEGKKKYDRSFLIDLRSDPQSQRKPEGLPEMDVVLKETNKKAMSNSYSNEFSPGPYRQTTKRSSQQGKPKPGKPPVIHMSLSLRGDVKLHETENAWKPGVRETTGEEETKTEELYRKMRGILNKLTPEKFTKLLRQVQALPIDTPERLEGVIDLVFDKAVDEPNFSVAYAELCRELKSNAVHDVSFQKLLIGRCQKEFEKNKAAEYNKDEKMKAIQAEPDPIKKKELQLIHEDEERKIRRKSVGNVRFIGELFKMGMLTPRIMIRCVTELLNAGDEESLECLCKLLTTIGKKLEEVKDHPEKKKEDKLPVTYEIAQCFKTMEQLAEKKGKGSKISSRIRFMLQDVIDLKNNKWVPRRQDLNPKTMDQIQKEAERESSDSLNLMSHQSILQPKNDRGGGRTGSMEKRGGKNSVSREDGGWISVGSKSQRSMDVNKLKGLGRESDVTQALGSSNMHQKWIGGSGSTKEKMSHTSNNYFSILGKGPSSLPADRPKPPRLESPLKEHSSGGFMSQNLNERGSGSRSSSQHRLSSQPSSRDSSVARGDKENEDRNNRVPTPTLAGSNKSAQGSKRNEVVGSADKMIRDEVQIGKICKDLVQELLSGKDMKTTVQDIEYYFDPTAFSLVARQCILQVLECAKSNHSKVGDLLVALHQRKLVTAEELIKELSYIFEMGEDLACDFPFIWSFFAAITVPLLAEKVLTFKDLATCTEVLRGINKSMTVFNNIIQILVREKGPSWIRDQWSATGVSLTDFVSPDATEEFLKINGLESALSWALASGNKLTQKEIETKLKDILRPNPDFPPFDFVKDWIDANVGSQTKEKWFIRALITAICENSLVRNDEKIRVNKESLQHHEKLLTVYVNTAELELQCLYAIQALDYRLSHPAGILLELFFWLWEDTVLCYESFNAYFQTEDPQEREGRGVALSLLKTFETALAEVDDGPEEDDDS